MKWFDRLIQMLRGSSNQSTTVSVENLGEWLDAQFKAKYRSINLQEESINYIKKLKDRRWYLEAQLDIWKQKVPRELKEELQEVFRNTKLFLDNLTFSEQFNFEQLLHLNNRLLQKIEELIKQVEGSSMASDFSFMVDEKENNQLVNPLFQELLTLANLIKNFENILIKKGFRALDSLREKMIKLQQLRKKIFLLNRQLEERKKRLEQATSKKKEKELECAKYTEQPAYNTLLQMEKLKQQKEEWQDAAYVLLSRIKPLLQEYLRDNDHVLARFYLEDPVEAFSTDEGLNLLHILDHLKAMLNAERSNFAANERSQMLGELAEISAEKLQKLQKELVNLNQQIEKLEEQDLDYMVAAKLDDVKYRLDHYQQQVIKYQQDITDIEQWLEQLANNLRKDKEMFRNIVQVGLGKEIKFSS